MEKFVDTYKKKIEEIIELENLDLQEDENQEEKRTLTLLLSEILRMEDYCDDTKVFEATFNELQDKVDAILFVLTEMKNRSASIKAEIDELTKTKKALETKRENLQKYLSESLLGANFTKFSTDKYEITFRKSESVKMLEEIDSDKLVNQNFAEYIRSKTEFAWDKIKIKEDLQTNRLPEEIKKITSIESSKNLYYRNRSK